MEWEIYFEDIPDHKNVYWRDCHKTKDVRVSIIKMKEHLLESDNDGCKYRIAIINETHGKIATEIQNHINKKFKDVYTQHKTIASIYVEDELEKAVEILEAIKEEIENQFGEKGSVNFKIRYTVEDSFKRKENRKVEVSFHDLTKKQKEKAQQLNPYQLLEEMVFKEKLINAFELNGHCVKPVAEDPRRYTSTSKEDFFKAEIEIEEIVFDTEYEERMEHQSKMLEEILFKTSQTVK